MFNLMIFWYAVVGLLLLVLMWHSLRTGHDARHHCARHAKHFVEIGKERDMFFAPGDPGKDDDDYCC